MSKIKIMLKSDLCNANGEGFASIIDTDIVADEYGIPFIPARRIKGCLREAAEDIEIPNEKLIAIFGESGAEIGGSLKFSSPAKLEDYNNIKNQVTDFSREEVLNLFTYTRAATAIDENGSADENSLRFIRVVKQYLPDLPDEKNEYHPLTFTLNCELDDKYKDDMIKICKALRNIGYKRNRGFGAVDCAYIPDNTEDKNNFPNIEFDDETEYIIPITLTSETPLIISAENNDETLDYIPGGSVLAAFASKYPNKKNKEFSELFLEDNIRFSNCYIGDIPAPLCYSGLKKDKDTYINLAEGEKAPDDDTAKPLKDKYLVEDKDNGVYHVSKVKKETIYHNTSQKIGLYTQTALSEGQEFWGTITGTGKYLKQIKEYFTSKSIRVGKSKTAQYSFCSICFGEAKTVKSKSVNFKVAVMLKSDILLIKDGVYTTDICELIKTLDIPGTLDKEKTSIAYTINSGYSGVYNLKKPQAKAFKAGSVLIFTDVDITKNIPAEFIIGARQGEGFGVCEAVAVGDMKKIIKKEPDKDGGMKEGIYNRLLIKARDNTNLKEKAIIHAKKYPLHEIITATQIGRFRRMLVESTNHFNFMIRINNVKTDAVRNEAIRYFRLADCKKCKEERHGNVNCKECENKYNCKNYRLFWDTVLLYHRFKRKIDEKKGGEE